MDNKLARYERAHRADPEDVALHLRYLDWKARAGQATPMENRQRLVLAGDAPSFDELLARCTRRDEGYGDALITHIWFRHEKDASATLMVPYSMEPLGAGLVLDAIEPIARYWHISGPLDTYASPVSAVLHGEGLLATPRYTELVTYDYTSDHVVRKFLNLVWLHHGGPFPFPGALNIDYE